MKRIELKDSVIEISDADEKYLDNVLEIVDVKSFKDMTASQFSSALYTEKMFSGEVIKLNSGGTLRMKQ
mgnify:CR=1 FL=1|jgi:hypothetical protein